MRPDFLPFAPPNTDNDQLNKIKEALDSGLMATGPKIHELETAFAIAVGNQHAIAVNSYAAAIQLTLKAIGLQPGDEVITTPYTPAIIAQVMRHFQANPVFVDIHPADFNIDINRIATRISSHTRAILPAHVGGLPVDLDKIYSIASEHNLAVIEDAAQAFPAIYMGQPVGGAINPTVKSAVCFSLETGGGGGMITTHDDVIAQRCRTMALGDVYRRSLTCIQSQDNEHRQDDESSCRPRDVAAVVGLAQLSEAVRMWRRRRQIAQHYNRAFMTMPELQIPHENPNSQHAWQLYMLRLNLERLNISREQFIEELYVRNIETSVHFIPLHLHPYYLNTGGYLPEDFPVTYQEYRREVSLPLHSRMADRDVHDVIEAVKAIVNDYKKKKLHAVDLINPAGMRATTLV